MLFLQLRAMMKKIIYFFIVAITLSGCAAKETKIASTPCVITPPEKSTDERKTVLSVKVELEAFAKASATPQADFGKKTEETYQKLRDKDVACSMLLRTVACLAENRSDVRVQEFQNYLKETRACERNEEANLSIDNILEVSVNPTEAFPYRGLWPIQVDIFLRNSGDSPATISSVVAKFDPHTEDSRQPQSQSQVSSIYTVAVDSNNATVTGAQLNTPARAYYPNPTNAVLIVDTPIAQTLDARSTDRFRIKYMFSENTELRGPREKVKFIVRYNDDKTLESKIIDLKIIDNCSVINLKSGSTYEKQTICRK